MEPATGPSIVNGMYEVSIETNVGGRDSSTVTNDVVAALETKFGTLAGQFDHVMIILPAGTSDSSFIGWGKLLAELLGVCPQQCVSFFSSNAVFLLALTSFDYPSLYGSLHFGLQQ